MEIPPLQIPPDLIGRHLIVCGRRAWSFAGPHGRQIVLDAYGDIVKEEICRAITN
jgi:hypothetical protein